MKFTYISTALLAIASAVRIESVPVIESPALLVQSEPATQMMSEPATQMMAMTKDGEFTPELVEELMAENPEFWGECIVWLFSLVTAQSEPATQIMAQVSDEDGHFSADLFREFVAENLN